VENQHRNYRLAVSSCAKNEGSFLAPMIALFSMCAINSFVVANNLFGRHCSAMSPTSTARRRNASRLNLLSRWTYCGLR